MAEPRRVRRLFGRKQAAVLNALYHMDEAQRAALLRVADSRLVDAISECALNILRGNVPLTKAHKARLRKHAPALRKIADSSVARSGKRRSLAQRGGSLLPAMLAPLLGALLANL